MYFRYWLYVCICILSAECLVKQSSRLTSNVIAVQNCAFFPKTKSELFANSNFDRNQGRSLEVAVGWFLRTVFALATNFDRHLARLKDNLQPRFSPRRNPKHVTCALRSETVQKVGRLTSQLSDSNEKNISGMWSNFTSIQSNFPVMASMWF